MQIKRFFAKETHKALRQVREALGPDAVIIANRQLADGVEIIATPDYDGSKPEQLDYLSGSEDGNTYNDELSHQDKSAAAGSTPERMPETASGRSTERASESIAERNNNAFEDVRAEIHQLRGDLESQLSALKVNHWGQNSKIHAGLFKKLSRLGLGIDLATHLVELAGKQADPAVAYQQSLINLAQKIKISQDNIIDQGGVVVLVGSTGSGKTTTLAKLATQYAKKHGAKGIVLVSADNRRIGAHEQLLVFGRLLGVPVLQARGKQELQAMLLALSDKKLVLVDSSGLGQSDLHHPENLPDFQLDSISIRQYLVIPATMQRASIDRIVDTVKQMNITACILTKVDESIVLGDVITSLIDHQTPLLYWSDGQNIRGDLYQAKADDLISKAVSMAKYKTENKDDRILLSLLLHDSYMAGSFEAKTVRQEK